MTKAEEMLDGAFEEEEAQEEEFEQEEHQEEESEQDLSHRIDGLEASLKQIAESLNSQNVQRPTQAAAAQEAKKLDLSDEQLAAIKEDPSLLLKYVDSKTEQTRKEMEIQKWDNKAYSDFPALKTDTEFANKVAAEVRSLVNTGAMTADNPQLLHLASKMVSASYKPKGEKVMKKQVRDGIPPRSTAKPAKKQENYKEDPNYRFLKMRYGSDEKKIKEVLERSKNRTYERGQNGRRVVRLGGF